MGMRLLSLRGDEGWRGQQTLHVSDRGERAFVRIENGYVSRDGRELRQFPGFFTLWDNSVINNPNGWAGRYIVEASRPIWSSTPAAPYHYYYRASAPDTVSQTLLSRALPTEYHGFEQVGNQIVMWGETRFREVPVYSSAHNPLTIASVGVVAGAWVIRMSGTVGTKTLRDAGGGGLNGVENGNPVYIASISIPGDPALHAVAQTELVGKVHAIASFSGTDITLTSLSSSSTGLTAATGEIHRVAPNRNNSYPTGAGAQHGPYTSTPVNRPNDPNQLTAWRLLDPLRPFDPILAAATGVGSSLLAVCQVSHVANRRRDFGDKQGAGDVEGLQLTTTRGISRREMRELPWRTGADAAGDRLLIAAPGYGCMFQVPLRVPLDASTYPVAPTGARGLSWRGNDLFDMVRALGIPKARLVEPVSTPAQASPLAPEPYNFTALAVSGSPAKGVGAGLWRMAISFEDEATGDEGLASEPVSVTIPTVTTHRYVLRVNYIHPGYIMPECLALRMNVYLAPPGQDALAFYGSFPLGAFPYVGDTTDSASPVRTNYNTSGHYGFQQSNSTSELRLQFRSFELPLLGDSSAIAAQLDPSRLAPQSASMPRGSSALKYLRGVLLAGGNEGNQGTNRQLWESRASARYEPPDTYDRLDEFQIRTHGQSWAVPNGGMDGDEASSALGGAGRCFPDAYQGIEVVSQELWPNVVWHRIDRVLNRRAANITNALTSNHLQHERLRLTRPLYGRSRQGSGGSSFATAVTNQANKPVFYVEPKGQLQIGDPGAPHRASKTAIQFIDANRGDDVVAIGAMGSTAIICTQRETWSLAWYRNPASDPPQLMTSEHGCIAANSMVEFDGGVAWISDRGPVAVGDGLQFVGAEIERDFGPNGRYLRDSKGMMRHTWAAHDAQRGLVMWGMVTSQNPYQTTRNGTAKGWLVASDEDRSRWPCDEVLVWSYRANAFTVWRPPTGFEVWWMRPVRCGDGIVRMVFLARDGRMYALDDEAHDVTGPLSAGESVGFVMATAGTGAIAVAASPFRGADGQSTTGREVGTIHVRPGHTVTLLNAAGEVKATTTVATVTPDGSNAFVASFTTTAPLTWVAGDTIRVGQRPNLRITTTFIGAEDMDALSVDAVQARYSLSGTGSAEMKLTWRKTDLDSPGAPKEIPCGGLNGWTALGTAQGATAVAHRREVGRGKLDAPEISLVVEVGGEATVRIADLSFEVP